MLVKSIVVPTDFNKQLANLASLIIISQHGLSYFRKMLQRKIQIFIVCLKVLYFPQPRLPNALRQHGNDAHFVQVTTLPVLES